MIETLEKELQELEAKLTGDMFQDMEIREEMFLKKKQINSLTEPRPERPDDSDFECFGCGS